MGKNRPIEEHEKILNFLSLWGYEYENEQNHYRFSKHKGVLTPSTFITLHKDKAEGLLIDVEPFYVACTFGLLAIDILTTTGARLNELLQINNTKECIEVKKVNNKLHYSYKAIPKGRDSLEEFYLSKQTMEHIQTVSKMLKHIMVAIEFQVSYTEIQESTYSIYLCLIIFNMQVKH